MGANSVQLRQLSSGLTPQGSSGFHLSVSKSTAKVKDSSPWPWLGSRNILRGSTYKQAGVCKAEGQRTFGARTEFRAIRKGTLLLKQPEISTKAAEASAALHPLQQD